jgi:indole-3-glycerol phosphate synthase
MTTKDLDLDVRMIIAAKQYKLNIRQDNTPNAAVVALADMQQHPMPILNVVTGGEEVTLIGQITHTETYDPVATALSYVRDGVDAISLFTDHRIYSKGMDDLLLVTRGVSSTPVIAQDYILNEYHVAEARAAGASALVAYASMLEPADLRLVVSSAQRWRMTTIIQVNDDKQLEHAIGISPHVIAIGIDQHFYFERDFESLVKLRSRAPFNSRVMPLGCLRSLRDVEAVLQLGVDAIIVDETLIKTRHIYDKLCEMLHRPD